MKSLRSATCQSETLRRIGGLTIKSPRQWGKMTVGQMVCHLTDGCQMATGERPVKEASSQWRRTGMKWLALYLPVPEERIQLVATGQDFFGFYFLGVPSATPTFTAHIVWGEVA